MLWLDEIQTGVGRTGAWFAHQHPDLVDATVAPDIVTLAKGLAGLGLPVIVFVAYLLFTWNWRRLARNQLGYGVLVALLGCAVVAIPWHHAMLARHGLPFWQIVSGNQVRPFAHPPSPATTWWRPTASAAWPMPIASKTTKPMPTSTPSSFTTSWCPPWREPARRPIV